MKGQIAMNDFILRKIEQGDNPALALIVRESLAEFKADKPGTVFFDESTDHLYELFQQKGAAYHVMVVGGRIAGGAGIFPTQGLDKDTCELVKMYLAPWARGKGLGKLLIKKCLESATELGYNKIYLETMPELINALPMYERFGFTYLQGPWGNSGHTGCSLWMAKTL